MRSAEHALSPENNSNRGQGESQIYSNKSWGYAESDGKRWDTSDPIKLFNFGAVVKTWEFFIIQPKVTYPAKSSSPVSLYPLN
jgi:hypothetical protein